MIFLFFLFFFIFFLPSYETRDINRVTIPLLLPLYEARGITIIIFVRNSGYRVAISLLLLCTKLGISCGDITHITLYKIRNIVWRYHSYYFCTKL